MTDQTDFYAVRPERTGFRDTTRLSNWHRKLGHNVPCCDIDAVIHSNGITPEGEVFCEYDKTVPKALIDYKAHQFRQSNSLLVYRELANMAGISFFVVVYSDDFKVFNLLPYNENAVNELRKMAGQPANYPIASVYWLSERGIAHFLYRLRDKTLPEHIAQTLDDSTPFRRGAA